MYKKIISTIFIMVAMIIISSNVVLAETWKDHNVSEYENVNDNYTADMLYALLVGGDAPSTEEELNDWIKRKNALTGNSTFNSLPNASSYSTSLTELESGFRDSVQNKQNGGSSSSGGNGSSEGRFQGIYSNWQSIPIEEFNTSIDDYDSENEWLNDVQLLYEFLRDDQIGIENMSKYFLQQYINKIRTLLDSEGFKRYESRRDSAGEARRLLENKYRDINLSESAMQKLEGTEEGDFIRESLPAATDAAGNPTSPDTIYTSQPHKNDTGNAGDSLDDVMSDADDFIGLGNVQYEGDLAEFSNTIYNILLAIGIIVAVIVGAIIGVKLMASNIDKKVEAKTLLIPYLIGCIVVFGGFAIWKIVVTVLQGV